MGRICYLYRTARIMNQSETGKFLEILKSRDIIGHTVSMASDP